MSNTTTSSARKATSAHKATSTRRQNINVHMDPALIEALDAISERTGRSRSAFVRDILEPEVKRIENEYSRIEREILRIPERADDRLEEREYALLDRVADHTVTPAEEELLSAIQKELRERMEARRIAA